MVWVVELMCELKISERSGFSMWGLLTPPSCLGESGGGSAVEEKIHSDFEIIILIRLYWLARFLASSGLANFSFGSGRRRKSVGAITTARLCESIAVNS